jgi:hypothetical protein
VLIVAEREGFEPSVPLSKYGSLANYSFRPLRHLSLLHFWKKCCKYSITKCTNPKPF